MAENEQRIEKLEKVFTPSGIEGKQEAAAGTNSHTMTAEEFAEEKARRKSKINYLYCLVFPVSPPTLPSFGGLRKESESSLEKRQRELDDKRHDVLRAIQKAGFTVQLVFSADRQKIFCKIGCNDMRLLRQANSLSYKLQLSPEGLKKALEETGVHYDYGSYTEKEYAEINQHTVFFQQNDVTKQTPLDQLRSAWNAQSSHSPFAHVHLQYSFEYEDKAQENHSVQIYRRYQDGTILRTADRSYLCQVALEQPSTRKKLPGAGLNLSTLQFEKTILASYPIHGTEGDLTSLELFHKFFTGRLCLPWRQPIQDMRNYAGEKIAYYFGFLEFYSLWLIPSALFGLFVFIWQLIDLYNQTGTIDFVTSAVSIELRNVSDLDNTSDAELRDFVDEQDYTTERTPFALSEDGSVLLFNLVPTELSILVPLYSVLIAFWAAFFLEFWKRREHALAYKWGVVGFEREAVVRPEFKSKFTVPDAITGLPTPYASESWFRTKVGLSISAVGTLTGLTIAVFFGTYVFKVVLSSSEGVDPTVATFTALFINAVGIYIFQYILKYVASFLTDWENHRTDLQHENYLILKTFVFSFFNSYTTLAYFAFFKKGSELRDETQFCIADLELIEGFTQDELSKVDSCYGALGYSLVTIFVTQIFINNAMEIGLPIASRCMAIRSNANEIENSQRMIKAADGYHMTAEEKAEEPEFYEHLAARKLISPAEQQFILSPYDSPFNDYLELALQFGYVTLFVAAFPLAPTLALMNNFIEVWVDAKKVCTLSRRPTVARAQDMGSWREVFIALSYIAVVVNSGVLVFTAREVVPADDEEKVWAFLGFIVGIYSIKYLVDFFVADIPQWCKIQIQRQRIFEKKLFFDEDESSFKPPPPRVKADHDVEQDFLDFEPLDVDPDLGQMVAEFKAKVKDSGFTVARLVKLIDSHKTEVSVNELINVLQNNVHMNRHRLAQVVRAIDYDLDGSIQKQELVKFFKEDVEGKQESV